MLGEPLDMGYCHCENCRRYSAAPVSAFTLWKKENVIPYQGSGVPRAIQEQRNQRPPVLHKVRQSHQRGSSHTRIDRCSSRRSPEFSVQTKRAPELCGDCSSNERWASQTQRFSGFHWWIGADYARVTECSLSTKAKRSLNHQLF